MSAPGYVGFWTPVVVQDPDPDPDWKKRLPASIAELYCSWSDKVAYVRGKPLQGCELVRVENGSWSLRAKAVKVVSYGFFVFHYALRHYFPRVGRHWSVTTGCGFVSLLPLMMLATKVWCRYGRRYYSYGGGATADLIPVSVKRIFDETVFGEWGKVDRLPMSVITSDAYTKLAPEDMQYPIEKYVVTHQTGQGSSICMKLSGTCGDRADAKVARLSSFPKKEESWCEDGAFFGLNAPLLIDNGILSTEGRASKFEALQIVAQGREWMRPSDSYTWRLWSQKDAIN